MLRSLPYIGKRRATILWDALGDQALKQLVEDPQAATAILPGVSHTQAREAAAELAQKSKTLELETQLRDLLDGLHLPINRIIRGARRLWGVKAPEFIRRNPAILLKISGIGIKTVLRIWPEMGLDESRLKLQTLTVAHALDLSSNPLPYKFIIVDETSMLDVEIAMALLSAVGDQASVLFVGDQNQLPSVGKGAVLRESTSARKCKLPKCGGRLTAG